MLTLSAAAQALLRTGGVAVGYAEVWNADSRSARLSVTAGKVTYDRTAAIPRSCSVTLAGFEAIIPDTGKLPPAATYADGAGVYGDGPYGELVNREIRGLVIPGVSELRLYWDLHLLDGAVETVRLGRYGVSTIDIAHTPTGVEVDLTGFDVSRRVQLAGYLAAFNIAAGTNADGALRRLLLTCAPGVAISTPGTTYFAPRLSFLPAESMDPWADAQKIAWACGWDLLTDRDGGIVATVPPDPSSGTAVWEITEASLTRAAISLDDAEACNCVVVSGQTAENEPVLGTAEITTGQWGSATIGRRTRFFTVETVSTAPQATNTAQGMLRKLMGLTDTIQIEVPPAPHLDMGDLVDVTDDTLQLDDTTYALERVVFDLDPTKTTQLTLSRRLA